MKQLSIFIILFSLLQPTCGNAYDNSTQRTGTARASETTAEEAYKNKQSDVQVKGEGVVTRTLADDNDGSRHQRFLIQTASGLSLLVAHNIDLAPRVADLKKGDKVEFYGEYVWNDKGGTVHWTHHDPRGRHVNGWIKHNYKTYQ